MACDNDATFTACVVIGLMVAALGFIVLTLAAEWLVVQ